GGVRRRPGGVHPRVPGAPDVPGAVGVLHVALSDHAERRVHRARQRTARGRAFGTERVEEEEWSRTLVDPGEGPDASAARAEERRRIGRALETLPPHHRAIIMLSDLEGLSYREIAEVLGIPMGTVMSRLHNARKRLRAALRPLLGVVLALLALLGTTPVAAQQIVLFGTRVVLASDTPP